MRATGLVTVIQLRCRKERFWELCRQKLSTEERALFIFKLVEDVSWPAFMEILELEPGTCERFREHWKRLRGQLEALALAAAQGPYVAVHSHAR